MWDVFTVDLTLRSREWLNYQIVQGETLLALEVEQLRDKIQALLDDELDAPAEIRLHGA